MVLFGKKENADKRELLESMNQLSLGKSVDNGELAFLLFKWLRYFCMFSISL